jgi:hypothetical protein
MPKKARDNPTHRLPERAMDAPVGAAASIGDLARPLAAAFSRNAR